MTYTVTWHDIRTATDTVLAALPDRNYDAVYGIPRGGLTPAAVFATRLNVPVLDPGTSLFPADTLIVDDLIDTGRTLTPYLDDGYVCATLFRKPHSPTLDRLVTGKEINAWLVFPWELDGDETIGPTTHVTRLLEYIGEDPTRDGLLDTPRRVLQALSELTAGYKVDVAALLSTRFAEEHDELIIVRHVPFWSLCEHHLLPFHGWATVGYVPRQGIVGLSKLARLVDAYARRLQVQERMTDQIAAALVEHLNPLAVGVLIQATHTCMAMRGINRDATMVTSKLTGLLRERPDLRQEFLTLAT